ncbi:MAG TPA: hypothetical protein H9986_06460 [Candidatus Prevotella stercoripullorum]|nr:hypothetical protein [Candidatus Prevotella stercoripullorum]
MKILSKLGNEALMQREKTAFVCSRKTPDGLEYLVGKWMLGLSPERDCVMCGNQSPMERAVFTTLLQRNIPTILCLAEAMPSRWSDDVRTALSESRLLIVTHCDGSVHNVTARSAFDRNVLMLSLAQKTVVGYCTKGGKLERALAGFDNVEYLENGQPWLKMPGEAKEEPARDEPKQSRLSQWSRALRLKRGTVYLDFIESGAEAYLKITHSVQAAGGGYEREKLFFDRKELAELLAAIRLLDGKLRSGEAVPPGLMVHSLSGDVMFGVSTEGGAQLLAMTQRKEYGEGKLRVQTVRLLAAELPMLVKGVEEALAEWK